MVSLTTMYPAQANSPTALLASGITDSATSITVDNGNILPVAPNWLTIGADTDDAETVLMTGKSGNVLTVTRGQQGTVAKAWGAGANVQRCFTASDHNVLIDNVNALNTGKAESSHDHTKSQITDFPATMAPSAHKSNHASGGSDALTPGDIGAQAAITASGILKGNGSAVSAATAGTDYVAPAALDDYLPKTIGLTSITANTTLAASHNGQHLVCANPSASTITVPSGLGAGFNCTLERWGAGAVTIAASSVTLNGASTSLTMGDRYDAAVSIIAVQADVFSVKGGLA